MALKKSDCQRALALLELYNKKLDETTNEEVKKSLENLIAVFKSRFFGALLDIQEYYADILNDVHQSPEQVVREASLLSKKWDSGNDEKHVHIEQTPSREMDAN